MVTSDQTARRLIRAWLKATERDRLHSMRLAQVRGLRHVYARAYVLARPAERCLVVARPWMDAEPHLRERGKTHGHDIVHDFDWTIQAGDWCACAYVVTRTGGWTVAVGWRGRDDRGGQA